MKKFFQSAVVVAIAFGLVSVASAAADKPSGSWTGYVTETHCAAKGATAEHADCAVKCVKDKGAKWALYTPDDKSVFVLSGDDAMMAKMSGMAGEKMDMNG